MSKQQLYLIYDKGCPACNYYCQFVRIRESVGELKLINAREHSDFMDEISGKGLDIDQGMVLKMGDQIFYGSNAIHILSLISTGNGFFNRINYWIFKSEKRASVIYPVLRFFRNLLLKILGKSKINNLELDGNDKF